MRRAVASTGTTRRSSSVCHARLRHFDLHLERDARPRVGPVVRRDEPARRGRRGERPPDLIDGDAELPGALAVDVDADRRIVERLLEWQVAQRRESRLSSSRSFATNARVAGKSGPVTATCTGVGAPKFMIRPTMSPGSKENCTPGNRCRNRWRSVSSRAASSTARVRLERDLQHALVRSARPQEDRVDRIRRRLDADVSERDLHVLRTGRALDLVQHVAREPLRRLELRAGRRPKPELELMGAAAGKDLAAEPRADERDDGDRADEIGRRRRARARARAGEARAESRAHTLDEATRRRVAVRCRGAASTDSTGTSVLESRNDAIIAKPTASDSGTNSERATPVMKNDGTNTATTPASRAAAARRPRRSRRAPPRAIGVPRARCVWMFSIATVASSTRMPTASARPPSVMMLIVCPAAHSATTAASSANGIVHDDDADAAPVAQEQQHHQAGQQRAEQPFAHDRLERVRHVARLIELERHLDVVGHERLEPRGLAFTSLTTASVDASGRLVTGM